MFLFISIVYPLSSLLSYLVLSAPPPVAVRGSDCGLSWTNDTLATYHNNDTWSVSVHGPCDWTKLQWKVYLPQSATWSRGPNFRLGAGDEATGRTAVYPYFFTDTGSYDLAGGQPLCSPTLDNCRQLIVYRPPALLENSLIARASLPLLVMHDGQNVFNDSTSFAGRSWRAAATLDALAAEGVLPPLVVAALYNTADRMDDYTYSACKPYGGGKGDLYLDFIEETALPAIAAAVPQASLSPRTLAMAGSSLGGLITAYAGYTRPHVYATTIAMSSSFWWNDQDFNNTVMHQWPAPPAPSSTGHRFYLDSGDAGPGNDDVVETKVVVKHLVSLGFVANVSVFHYVDAGGRHSEEYWGDRFHIPLTWLYGQQNV